MDIQAPSNILQTGCSEWHALHCAWRVYASPGWFPTCRVTSWKDMYLSYFGVSVSEHACLPTKCGGAFLSICLSHTFLTCYLVALLIWISIIISVDEYLIICSKKRHLHYFFLCDLFLCLHEPSPHCPSQAEPLLDLCGCWREADLCFWTTASSCPMTPVFFWAL